MLVAFIVSLSSAMHAKRLQLKISIHLLLAKMEI